MYKFKTLLIRALMSCAIMSAFTVTPLEARNQSGSICKKDTRGNCVNPKQSVQQRRGNRPKLRAGVNSTSEDAVASDANAGQASVKVPKTLCNSVLVLDAQGQQVLAKRVDTVHPIASITKLMMAMVVLDANLPLDEMITITEDDKDTLRYSRSRLLIGKATLSRENMLRVALMSSDNRAAHALGRTAFPGGIPEFVRAMNAKAQSLGMTNSTFADPTGLFAENVSTATDLSKMVRAASQYQLIREITSTGDVMLEPHPGKKPLQYVNTNRLVRSRQSVWNINLSKTGYIREAGKCLVMEATLPSGVYDFVFLNGPNQSAPFTDAERLRKWLEKRAVSAN